MLIKRTERLPNQNNKRKNTPKVQLKDKVQC